MFFFVFLNLQLVQKSFSRLLFNDFTRNASSIDEAAKEKLAPFSSLSNEESYQSRDLEKVCNHLSLFLICVLIDDTHIFGLTLVFLQASQQVAKPLYDAKVQPSTLIPKQVGNMYTASLYAAFASLIHNKSSTLVKIS